MFYLEILKSFLCDSTTIYNTINKKIFNRIMGNRKWKKKKNHENGNTDGIE